jgi:hypothetical protein
VRRGWRRSRGERWGRKRRGATRLGSAIGLAFFYGNGCLGTAWAGNGRATPGVWRAQDILKIILNLSNLDRNFRRRC